MTLEAFGVALAIGGSSLSIIGTLYNNLKLDHHKAMHLWMLSNPLLLIWAVGYGYHLWNSSLSAGALVLMYLVFTVTNFYGLFVKRRIR